MKTELIDYAYPCMMAEKALRDAHNSILKRDYDAALESAMQAVVECRIMVQSIREMREQSLLTDSLRNVQ